MNVTAPTRMRILIVITKANWGGAQRYVYTIAKAALDAGHEVTVACGSSGELVTRLESAHVPVISVPGLTRDAHAANDIRAFRELVKLMQTLKPTVVQTNSSKAGGLAALAARFAGVPRIIFTAHGWAFNEKRPLWQKIIIGLLHYMTVLLSDETICVSNAVKRNAAWMLFVQKRLIVIRNGIGHITFLPRKEARTSLLPNASDDSLWLATIAELHPTKQVDVAIRAFAEISEKFPTALFFIMGDGQERKNLETLIEELGLSKQVHLCGHVKRAPEYLSAFDAFVLPSRSEALGFAILEAGMAKLPVVASRVGGIPEIITDGQDGLLVDSGNVEQLATAFTKLFSERDLRDTLGSRLYDRVSKSFSEKRMLAETLSTFVLL